MKGAAEDPALRARAEVGAAARSAPAFVLYEAAMRFKGLILVPVLTGALPLESYGLYVQAMVVMGLGAALSGFHLHHALVRFLPGARSGDERSKVVAGCIGLTAAGNLLLVPPLCLAAVLLNAGLRPIIVPLAFLIASETWLQLLTGIHRASERIAANLIANTAVVLCDLAVVSAVAVLGGRLRTMLTGMILIRTAVCLLLGAGMIGDLRISKVRRPRLLALMRFSGSMVLGAVAAWVVDSSDRIVLGLMLGDAWVGAYNPAYVFGTLLLVVPRLAGTLLPPMAARLHDRGEEEVLRFILQRYWRGLLLVSIPFVAGTVVLQDAVLSSLATRRVADVGRWVAPIVATGTFFYAAAAIFGEVMKLKLRPGQTARAWILAAAVNVGLNLLLIPRLGLIAAALSTAVSFSLAFVLVYRASSRLIPTALEPETALRCALACAPMLIAFRFLEPAGLAASLALAGAGAGVYLLLVFGMHLVRRDQVARIWWAVQGVEPAEGTR